jgi:Tfp pilus assembly protein PilE
MSKLKRRIVAYSISVLVVSVLVIVNYMAGLPSFTKEHRAKASELKAIMHTFQKFVERYGEEHNGRYPKSAKQLYSTAKKENYWEDLKNPYFGQKGKSDNVITVSEKAYRTSRFFKSQTDEKNTVAGKLPRLKGYIVYIPEDSEEIRKYYIYGIQKDGSLLQNRGELHVLTNR